MTWKNTKTVLVLRRGPRCIIGGRWIASKKRFDSILVSALLFTIRPVRRRNADAASEEPFPIHPDAFLSMSGFARVAVIVRRSRTAYQWCRLRRVSDESDASTSRLVTRIIHVERGFALASSQWLGVGSGESPPIRQCHGIYSCCLNLSAQVLKKNNPTISW